jgi:hypothetical protein
MYTNVDPHGGKFLDVVDREMKQATDVAIASGYTSFDILNRYKDDFYRIANDGGSSKLLLGMAFYEGLSSNKLNLLHSMDGDLRSINNKSGVFVTYSGKYHGKIYKFAKGGDETIYVGSSNFSRSGLSENIEATALIKDSETIGKANSFLEFLLSEENAVSILKADITVPGTTKYLERLSLKTLDDLEQYNPESIDKTLYPHIEYPLTRIAEKEKSNLNVYFGKGRWSRASGEVRPRPWYEVELIANKDINQDPLYPKGDFLAYTDDGYIIPMKTSGDYFKNIRSRGNLRILGQWIKGKLQKSGALIPLTPVTQDTLDTYGNDTIRFYKIDENRYYMEF